MTMSVDVNQAKSIFLAVLEVPSQQRASFLDAQCGSDQSLRRRVAADAEVPTNLGRGVEIRCEQGWGRLVGVRALITHGGTPGMESTHNSKPNEWPPFDMIVQGNSVKLDLAGAGKVNLAGGGKAEIGGAAIASTSSKPGQAGPLILRLAKDNVMVELRKIRIKDLATTNVAEPPP
jgi:hypothetical protein